MSLSAREVDELIEKLRRQYREFGEKFDPKWFNKQAFEERLVMALDNKMNLENFVLGELANFDQIKTRYETAQLKKKTVQEKPFTKRVEAIIKENVAKIQKYPRIQFHDSATEEIAHLYGALNIYTEYLFVILWIVVNDHRLKTELDQLEFNLNQFAVKRGSEHAKRIQDHMRVLERPYIKEIEIEKDSTNYIKECGFLLHDIADFCQRLLKRHEPLWEEPLNFDKLYVDDENVRQKIISLFEDMNGYQAIAKVKESAEGIIDDFRLRAFKK